MEAVILSNFQPCLQYLELINILHGKSPTVTSFGSDSDYVTAFPATFVPFPRHEIKSHLFFQSLVSK